MVLSDIILLVFTDDIRANFVRNRANRKYVHHLGAEAKK